MAQLNRMKYCVTQSGYSAQVGDGVISQSLDGGAPRYRRQIKGAVSTAGVQWVVDAGTYQYLMAFYRVWCRNPAQPFLCKLCIDNAPVEDYECYFASALKLDSKVAGVYTVTATLTVKRLKTNDAMDDLIVAFGNEDQNLAEFMNPLEQLVNVDLPDALENINKKIQG